VKYTDRSAFQYYYFLQEKKNTDNELSALKARVDRKNQPEIKLDDFTGEYVNTVYGKITVAKSSNFLVCHFEHHPELLGYMEYMDNNTFRLTYNNIAYGIYPAKFVITDGKPTGVEIQVNEFVDPDIYLFVKDPKGIVVR
ncbi:MAG: serine hydrolase, partial [Chitinophagaceae bacterium]|nr:serine hydrolase [Chitinophagaceae bacterium]